MFCHHCAVACKFFPLTVNAFLDVHLISYPAVIQNTRTEMTFSLKQLLLVGLASWSTAQHFEPPVEIDVESPSMCKTNSDGFGGRPLSTEIYEESTYYYELTIAGTDTGAAVSDLEIRIADYLLAESSLFDVCARRLNKVPSRHVRRLQPATGAVAITTRPDDLPYDDSEFDVLVVSVVGVRRTLTSPVPSRMLF